MECIRQTLVVRCRFVTPGGLLLQVELDDWDDVQARAWAAAMRPLAQTITDLLLAWLPKATYPSRDGMHGNTAFGLARSLPWARRLALRGEARLLAAISEAARRWAGPDRRSTYVFHEHQWQDLLH